MTAIIIAAMPFILQVLGYLLKTLVTSGQISRDEWNHYVNFLEVMDKKNMVRIKDRIASEEIRERLRKRAQDELNKQNPIV